MKRKKVLVVSGLSGAGKSSVSNVLEDLGYLCIDQFPSDLIKPLLELLENDRLPSYDNVAITVPIHTLTNYFPILDNLQIESRLILLDCARDVLLNRYKFTRRIHPLLINNVADTLEEAIDIEKEDLLRLNDKFDVIDTTELGPYELKAKVEELLEVENDVKFTISFESFGFKKGVPQDADLVFDVRFLDNPYYYDHLRNLTGNDSEVFEFVMAKQNTKEYIGILCNYLDYSFKQYVKEGKRHLTVAVGCTGGQHRSASLVNYLYAHYKEKYNCLKYHRDIKK